MCDGPPCPREPPLGRCRVEVPDGAPDLAARQPKHGGQEPESAPGSGPELGVLGVEPVVVAVADVLDVQKVESGGFGDDPRGVLDHEDVEYLRLPRLRSNPAG